MFALLPKQNLLMRTIRLWTYMLSALMVLGFLACENEPLEGDFVTDDGVEEADFVATINGESFSSNATTAVLNNGVMAVSGTDASGNTIVIAVSNIGECTFNLANPSNSGSFVLNGEIGNPYLTLDALGGSGTAVITSYDPSNQTVSGTFNFNGVREIPDGSGGTTLQTIVITAGSFNNIPFNVQAGTTDPFDCDTGGSGGGGTGLEDPEDSFFALLDGVEFIDVTLTTEEIMVGSSNVVKVAATAQDGSVMQFFIPSVLGVGTYDFEPIFDGSNLNASYTASDGTESLTSGQGSITFTEFGFVTGKIAATFNFVGSDPTGSNPTIVTITEGAFNVDYLPDSGTVENIFMATIDGEEYLPSSIEIVQNPSPETTSVNVTTINEATNQSVSLSFPINITAGNHVMSEFVVDGSESVGIFNPDIGNSILFKSNPGVLTIYSYQYGNGVMEGSFVFTAIDPLGNDPSTFEISGTFTLTIP